MATRKYPDYINVEEEVQKFISTCSGKVRKNGYEYELEICPFCHGGVNHDLYKFSINYRTGQYQCKRGSCGKQGNLYTLSADDAIDYELPKDVTPRIRKHSFRTLKNTGLNWPTDQKVINYLQSRGIGEDIARRYEITECRKDEYKGWLIFPFISVDNNLIYAKYRNMDYKKGDPGAKEYGVRKETGYIPALFGMKQCNLDSYSLVMTEGQIDTLSCAEAGIDYAVSVPTGQGGFKWYKESDESREFLNRFDELIIFGDNENGHITLLDGMRSRFNGRIRVVREEDYCGCKDANEMLQKEGVGAEGIRKAIKNAELLPVKRTKDISEIVAKNMKDEPWVETGIYSLDKLLHNGVRFGQLMIITGERGKGKSTLLSQMALFAIRAGENVFFYSGEMTETEWLDWFLRQAAGETKVDYSMNRFGDKDYYVSDETRAELMKQLTGRVRIYDNEYISEDSEDEDDLIETIKKSIKQYGCRVICIDNLMTAIEDNLQEDLYRKQAEFIGKLAVLARHYKVVIYVVAHPKKSDTRGKSYFHMDDIMGSGNIANLANVIIRYDVPDDADNRDTPDRKLYVYKARGYGQINSTKGIELKYHEASKRIYEPEYNYDWSILPEDEEFMPVQEELEIPF